MLDSSRVMTAKLDESDDIARFDVILVTITLANENKAKVAIQFNQIILFIYPCH